MSIQTNQPVINLQRLMNAQFDEAKLYQNIAIGCGIVVLGIDVCTTVHNQHEKALALIATGLVVMSVLALWRSSRMQNIAEGILRKFEFRNGLNWPLSGREVSDILASAPNNVKKAARSTEPETYFTDTQAPSVQRLLKNLEESAWWTKHLARRMVAITALFSTTVFLIVFIILIISLQSVLSPTASDIIAKITINIIAFIFTGGYFKLAFDYNLLATEAERAEERACDLLKLPEVVESEAVKALHDYQIARATSPLLPSWIWKLSQKELDTLWKERVEGKLGT
jgi:hypothetical protein